MHNRVQQLENRYINKRLKTAIIRKRKSELNLDDFDSLLDFTDKTVKVFCEMSKNERVYSKELMVLLKQNFLADKQDGTQKRREVKTNITTENIDFSMFDDLINDVNEKLDIKEKPLKKRKPLNIPETLKYLKKEIRYYEKKLDNDYKLDNLENEEENLFVLKIKIEDLKEKVSTISKNPLDSINDYKFSLNDDATNIFYYCKTEVQKIEYVLNHKDKKITDIDIENKIDKNIKVQESFIIDLENKINEAQKKIKNKIHLCMLKRMIYNLFKMAAGVYLTEVSKHDGLKIMVGSFLVINSISGIKEAISLKEQKQKYYKYSDYTSKHLSRQENIVLASNLLDKSLNGIDELKKEFKKKFQHFKEYIDDYEEIYFKFDKLKEIIMDKQLELCELSMNKEGKIKVLEEKAA